jgi:hypothetical protein
MAMSFEDRQQKLRAALEQKFPRREGSWESGPYLVATFDAEAVIQRDGKLWKIGYTITEGQDVTLAEPELVEVQYESVAEAVGFERALDRSGATWDVRVLRFGVSRHGWLWTRESGEALLPHLGRVPIGCYEYANGFMGHASEEAIRTAGGPVVRNIVGDLSQPRLEPDGVYGRAHIHESAGGLRKKLLEFAERGLLQNALGLSIDTFTGVIPVQVREGSATEPRLAKWVRKVERVLSVDIVTAPSADGRFIRATEAQSLFTHKEDVMTRSQLIELAKGRPDLLKGRTAEALTDPELEVLVREGLAPPPAAAPPTEDPIKKRLDELERRDALRESQARVREALTASGLPAPIQEKLGKQLAARVVEATELDSLIAEEKTTLAKLFPESGEPRGVGRSRVDLGPEAADKLQVGLDRLFGLDAPVLERVHEAFTAETAVRVREALAPVIKLHKDAGAGPHFTSLREAYARITGDVEVRGVLERARIQEAVQSNTWPNILGNTLYRMLLMAYAEQDYGERRIITVGRAEDFRTKEAVRLKYFGDLSEVNPETIDWPEIAAPGDEKVSYSVIQKGNTLTITRKTIINDDLRTVQRLVQYLGRSARRTFAKYVWNKWINNDAYDVDGTAWFHADHGSNLLAVALSAPNVATAVTNLAKMTEPGSSEKLGLSFARGLRANLWLAVPIDLWDTAKKLNEQEYLDAAFTANPVRYFFGEANERIIVNPLFSDATDWGVFRDAADLASIVIDFLQGREEPELFLADQPTVGEMFKADKLQYKIRHEYGGDVIDFRGAVKSVVA